MALIWITGSKGMLGKELYEFLKKKDVTLIGTDNECDITDREAINRFSKDKKIDWIVNCSAYTAVDKAEDECDAAFRINKDGACNLAMLAVSIGAKLIHISTDYVFNGNNSKPYKEDDAVNPLGVYGRSKLAGENKIKEIMSDYFIIRTSWLYGRYGNNFVNTMIRLFNERESLSIVNDQIGCPTWAYNLAEVIYYILKNNSDNYGIYHFSNKGETSWYEFACEIYHLTYKKGIITKKVKILPLSSDQFPSKVKRPFYSVLALDKITHFNYIKLSEWHDSLNKYIDSINLNY